MIELKWRTTEEIAKDIAGRVKKKRRAKKISQKELSKRSGVSYGSVKRFEQTGEISLASLLKIAMVFACEDDFDDLFSRKEYTSIDEVISDAAR